MTRVVTKSVTAERPIQEFRSIIGCFELLELLVNDNGPQLFLKEFQLFPNTNGVNQQRIAQQITTLLYPDNETSSTFILRQMPF